jgi:DNA recombination protein RmuC
MTTAFLIILLALSAINLVFLFVSLKRNPAGEIIKFREKLDYAEQSLARLENAIKDESGKTRQETNATAKDNRQEMSANLKSFNDSLLAAMSNIANLQKNQLDVFSGQLTSLTRMNEQKLEAMRATVEEKLKNLQDDNNTKLEQMRATVDEKLHNTLEKRLGESFKLVSERLELVSKGLGEMQSLANGVGDLKKVLTNVKTRGMWGEVQLENLLEEILTREQYAKNVVTKIGSNERVEFAIKLPGKDGTATWLPIDAKFPLEDYQKLVEAQEKGDIESIETAAKALETRIKSEAKDIKEKYIDPPNTTDFGILFLPVEGLYAEVLRKPGLSDTLRKDYRVSLAGPTTISAILNSLQMGFRTLAIEKRASEVWQLLGAVKTEFGKFNEILERTQKKLQEAANIVEDASKKSHTIERKLKNVQELPVNAPDEHKLIDTAGQNGGNNNNGQ